MIRRLSQLADSRWWAVLAVLLAIVTVARTNTVDAPADAMAPEERAAASSGAQGGAVKSTVQLSLPSASGGSLEEADGSARYLWTLESEIRALESELAVERARAQLLQGSYSALEGKFLRLTAALPLLVSSSASQAASGPSPPASEQRKSGPATVTLQQISPAVPASPQGAGLQLERNPR